MPKIGTTPSHPTGRQTGAVANGEHYGDGPNDPLRFALYDCERAVRDLDKNQTELADKVSELNTAILDLTEEVGFRKLRTDIIALTSAMEPLAELLGDLTSAVKAQTDRMAGQFNDPVAIPDATRVDTGFRFSEQTPVERQVNDVATRRKVGKPK